MNPTNRHLTIRHFLRARDGVALIEFAILLPVLFLLLFGAIELSRFMLISQRVDRASYALGDITAQYMPATSARASAEISGTKMENEVLPQLQRILGRYASDENQSVLITSVYKDPVDKTLRIKWQVGSGLLSNPVTVSVVNGIRPDEVSTAVHNQVATFTSMQGDLADMPDGENMLVIETFYRYQPILQQILSSNNNPFELGARTIARRTYMVPRNGALLCLPEEFTDASC